MLEHAGVSIKLKQSLLTWRLWPRYSSINASFQNLISAVLVADHRQTHLKAQDPDDARTVQKTTSQNLWPELIRINEWIKTYGFKKPTVYFSAASAAKIWKCDISSAPETAFLGVFGDFFACSTPSKRGVLVHKNSLASCQRCRHGVEPCALTCPFKHINLIGWSLLSWHVTHTYLWVRPCFIQVVCSPLSFGTSNDSNYVNRSASLDWVRSKSTEADEYDPLHLECMRTRQSPYKIVADGSNEGGTSHWIVLFCEWYWLAGVGGRGCGQRVSSGGEELLPAQSERFPSVESCRL